VPDEASSGSDGRAGGASVGGASVGGASVGGASVGGASVGGASVGGASVGGASVGGASVGGASVGDVSLGDVIRAWRLLGATTDDERRAIARTLGFDLRDATPAPRQRPTASPIEDDDRSSETIAREPAPPPVTEQPQPIELVPFTDVEVNPVALPAHGLPRPAAVAPAVLEPLFTAAWSRAIASTLTEHSAPVGPIDIERTIDLLARRLPIRRLPRRKRLVSATEVVVVVDSRGTLAWFRNDADLLVDRLDAVTRAAVGVVDADGAPVLTSAMGASGADGASHATGSTTRRRAVAGRDDDRDDDDDDIADDGPPRARVRIGAQGRVIGLTDLGLGSSWMPGDPGRTDAWIALAITLRARGASLVIVTPVPIERLPSRLLRLVPSIYWDRSTRPGTVHRLVKGRT
jgi:hypothetical protein